LSHSAALENKNTSILLAAKELRERMEIHGFFFALFAFFRGQTALV
jgi:hypothetical protein